MLFECLTGRTPFSGDSLAGLLYKNSSPPLGSYSARRIRPELPAAVDAVIDRMTRPNPAERYPRATAAIDELTRLFYSGGAEIGGAVVISYAREDRHYATALA